MWHVTRYLTPQEELECIATAQHPNRQPVSATTNGGKWGQMTTKSRLVLLAKGSGSGSVRAADSSDKQGLREQRSPMRKSQTK